MKTITYYHGTNNNAIEVADNAKVTSSINGLGFYTSTDIDVARKYGRNIIAFVMNVETELKCITRPIDQRYVEGLASYDECAASGMETVFSCTHALILDAEDVIITH